VTRRDVSNQRKVSTDYTHTHTSVQHTLAIASGVTTSEHFKHLLSPLVQFTNPSFFGGEREKGRTRG